MSLKKNKINALNALDIRKVDFPAVHFHFVKIPKFNPNYVKTLDNWIYNNLNGRYYIGSDVALNESNSIIYVTKIGFENEKEITFFKIACPLI
jgi:hypothetical protein